MSNFFYYDAGGNKRGPLNMQQLQTLATKGIISPKTILETDDGHKGAAGQIPELKFDTAEPLEKRIEQQRDDLSIVFWLVDFGFDDIRIVDAVIVMCRVLYFLSFVGGILYGLIMSIFMASNAPFDVAFLYISLLWLGIAVSILVTRLSCEWCMLVTEWIDSTAEAAKKYLKRR
jgi:xanthosine utilization system XapX-like protein